MENFDVIVCGSLHLDIMVRTPALPCIDETAVGHGWTQVCGGKGGNQAVQAAHAGARAAMIGRIGRDAFGQKLRQNLVDSHVDVSGLSVDDRLGSGLSVAIVQDDGNYGAVIVSEANLALDPAAVQRAWNTCGGARVLVLQNEVPHAVNVAAAMAARAQGAMVLLNAAPARTLGEDLLSLVDVLVVNRVEVEAMTGLAVQTRASVHAALAALGAGFRSVIVTLGGEGIVVAPYEGTPTDIAAVPVKVTSTHGAGDCFVGVLAARLAAGTSLVDACLVANEQAAVHVSRPQ